MRIKAMVLPKRRDVDWRVLERSLYHHFGVNAVAFTKNGDRRTREEIDLVNGICYLIKKHPNGARRICQDIQSSMNHEAHAKKRYITEECDAGIFKIVVPVIQEDEVEGFISTCGRPYINADRIYTHYIHEIIDEDEKTIENLLSTLVPINPRTVKDLINYITSYA